MTGVTTAVLALWCALAGGAQAQTGANAPQPATSAPAAPTAHETAVGRVAGAGLALYRQLSKAGLDGSAVYNVRDAAIDREDLHVILEDGTIGFLKAVDGRVTGAFFEGEGEVLLFPPEQAERGSLALFTGAAVLEEKFTSAYFRFNDDTREELQPTLRGEEAAAAGAFVEKYDGMVRTLAEADGLRLMTTYLNRETKPDDRLFRARLQGVTLGVFDVYFDTLLSEQITVLKLTYTGGTGYYDVLASFPMRSARRRELEERRSLAEEKENPTLATPARVGHPGSDKGGPPTDKSGATADESGASAPGGMPGAVSRLRVRKYTVRAKIDPPNTLSAEAQLEVEVRQGGQRIEFFELSRYLKVSSAEMDGKPVEFLQNEAIEGSALARRGNDVVAVVFPEALHTGQHLHLKFSYAGNVLSDAGGGLLYVGARGIWYPNRGLAMADYDLQFRYPRGWTLVATGKEVSEERAGGEQVVRYVSERPMPLAGFNLGRYTVARAHAGKVLVEAYATSRMERTFTRQEALMTPPPPSIVQPDLPPLALAKPPPVPSSNTQTVAEISVKAIDYFSRIFGPYPYSSLALSQMPGRDSQGWPGLVFLSSYAFLSPQERQQAHLSPQAELLFSGFMQVHETAHQWWGDLVGWKSYRDQWLVEALATYSSILMYERDRPEACKQLLQHYREQLLAKNAGGEEVAEAGPVTLGLRLSSSHFPNGYDTVSYGRGAWLLHMLRTMMRDGAQLSAKMKTGGGMKAAAAQEEEPFMRALRKVRERYAGKEMSTADFLHVMEEEMPDSLRYEGSKSLDWFYQGWVKGEAIPRLELKKVSFTRHRGQVTVSGEILQEEAPEDLVTSVPVYATVDKKLVLLGRVFADGRETNFRLNAPAGAKRAVLDPHDTVLKR